VEVPSLGGRTPLQAAATPCLDALVRASGGLFGLLDPLAPGIACVFWIFFK
jgi:2,3-bisphosphoglycerate-independent phosphoglycerate mutase